MNGPVTLRVLDRCGSDDWSRITEQFREISLLQSFAYGDARESSGRHAWRAVFERDGEVVGACQAIIRPLPRPLSGGVVWVNRGPLSDRSRPDPALRQILLGRLRDYWVDQRAMYLIVAPPWPDTDVGESPTTVMNICRAISPWSSAVVDLRRPEAELWRGLRENWRRHIKTADRLGLVCRSIESDADQRSFTTMYDEMREERQLHGALSGSVIERYAELCSPAERPWQIGAFVGDDLVGGVVIARFGRTGEYLAGVTTQAGRTVNAGHSLLWRAMRSLKTEGYEQFDLGGMHPTQTPKGILHFKSGFGGVPYTLSPVLSACRAGLVSSLISWRLRAVGGH